MKKIVKASVALALFGTICGGAAIATATTYAKDVSPVVLELNNQATTYQGEKIIGGTTTRGLEFKYSDGLFKKESKYYDPHMATISCILTRASENYAPKDDYSNGAKDLVDMYKQMGYENIYVSDSYNTKPTIDSIGCVIASKKLSTGKTVISLTVRSAGYDAEWVSNVKLGKEGEAQGFKEAAERVLWYVNDFVNQNGLSKELDSGNIKFWLSGFSRGAATANIAAKKLVDKYQPQGNEMYAYCIESPAGGVRSEMRADRDYDGIHYIINDTDLVTFVAPEVMGFDRYGVCHYLIGSEASYSRVEKAKARGAEILMDNIGYSEGFGNLYDKQKELFLKQSEQIKSGTMPFNAKRYKLNMQDFSIVEDKDNVVYFDSLVYNRNLLSFMTDKTTRAQYVNEGIEKAASNLLEYTYSGGLGIKGLIEALTKGKSWFELLPIGDVILALNDVRISAPGNPLERAYQILFDRSKVEINLKLDEASVEGLASGFTDNLFKATLYYSELFNWDNLEKILVGKKTLQEVLTKGFNLEEVFEQYPGGINQAKKDTKALLKFLFKSVSDVNEVITIAMNIEGIIDNHSQGLTEAWLRTYDSWYESTVKERRS